MSDDPETKDEADRTVFIPSTPPKPAAEPDGPGTTVPPLAPGPPASETPPDRAAPSIGWDAAPPGPGPTSWATPASEADQTAGPGEGTGQSATSWGPAQAEAPSTSFGGAQPGSPATSFRAPSAPGRVEVGAVLNNIYLVKRFIARGGMGEVYEGENVNTEERVAIKVMLPTLAADPNVQAMFRKEARTLTRLHHPAVVNYRVLAQEPQLGVFYIVTEFIDGPPLSELLGVLRPTPQDLRGLTRRLAEGLGAAHKLGAVHRDMSPDNVLLPGRLLDQAKIIDFGIAKDLDPSKATIVGEGFAGKLGYVAPEQFGDYGREIGPWTDIYSLGLVILATALGRNVDMGSTLVEAVDKRRAGPDLSPIPADLRAVLERMLQADPAKRFRSMDEVIAALDQGPAAPAPTIYAPAPRAGATQAPAAPRREGKARQGSPLPLILGGGAAAVVVIAAALFLLLPKGGPKSVRPSGGAPAAPVAPAASAGSSVELAQRAINAALPGIPCTWLDILDIGSSGGSVAVKLSGVAGSPVAAQAAVARAASNAGVGLGDINLENVAPVGSAVCAPLDAVRQFRADTSVSGKHISSEQPIYQIRQQPDGKMAATAIINMAVPTDGRDFELYGMETDGTITALAHGRSGLAPFIAQKTVEDRGGGNYRLSLQTWDQGWKGLLLVTGKSLAQGDILAGPASQHAGDWANQVRAAGLANGWRTEMTWYKIE